jgi:multimeric flavodoxin WrbA
MPALLIWAATHCFINGEDSCPHAGYVNPITKAVTEADLVILSSPVYGPGCVGSDEKL